MYGLIWTLFLSGFKWKIECRKAQFITLLWLHECVYSTFVVCLVKWKHRLQAIIELL